MVHIDTLCIFKLKSNENDYYSGFHIIKQEGNKKTQIKPF
jgi:hypothetical protein